MLSDIEAVPFNKGFFTVDLKFFFKITLDVFCGLSKPTQVEGLATFDKKVVLFGSQGNAKVFQSRYTQDSFDPQLWKKTNMPKAVIEVVDPICLSARVVDICDKFCCGDSDVDFSCIPENIHRVFDEPLVLGGESKRAFVSLGLFSIIKLERNVQLLIPAFDFCLPDKECISATESDPCDLFDKIKFPTDEFFPPQKENFEGAEGVFEKPKFCDC